MQEEDKLKVFVYFEQLRQISAEHLPIMWEALKIYWKTDILIYAFVWIEL